MKNAELKQKAFQTIDAAEPELVHLAQEILAHPELGYEEVSASRWLSQFLTARGFETIQPFGNLPTAFKCTRCSSKPGPHIAFLAEYDSLPGVGHGCGHNMIGPAAVGAAAGVGAVLSSLYGSLSVIGTPAEEYVQVEEGKIKLLAANAFEGVDATLMLHPDTVAGVTGSSLGFVACEFHFEGRTAHASADPWNGINALDGVIATFNNISALRQQLRPDVRIHGIITDGGLAPNIIPQHASARFMVRAPEPAALEELYRKVQDCARGAALATQTQLRIDTITTVYNIRRNHTLNQLVLDNLRAVGLEPQPELLGGGGSTDFGNISQIIPSAMFSIPTHQPGTPWHSKEVIAGSGTPQARQAFIAGTKALAASAIDLLADLSCFAGVRAEHQAG